MVWIKVLSLGQQIKGVGGSDLVKLGVAGMYAALFIRIEMGTARASRINDIADDPAQKLVTRISGPDGRYQGCHYCRIFRSNTFVYVLRTFPSPRVASKAEMFLLGRFFSKMKVNSPSGLGLKGVQNP